MTKELKEEFIKIWKLTFGLSKKVSKIEALYEEAKLLALDIKELENIISKIDSLDKQAKI